MTHYESSIRSLAHRIAEDLRTSVTVKRKDGSISTGQIRNGKSLNNLKPGFSNKMAQSVGNDFAGRQVISLAAQNCCAGGSGDSCNHFSKVNKSGTNTSPSSSSPSEDQPGAKGVR